MFTVCLVLGLMFCSCKLPSPVYSPIPTKFSATSTIPASFIRTCRGCGFDNLNTWQQFNRILWNLDYIGWEQSTSADETKIQAVWSSSHLEGQILCSLDKSTAPYLIEGAIEVDDNTSADNLKLSYRFTNLSPQTVSSITLVFFVFDEDGNTLENSRSSFSISMPQIVEANQSVEDFIDLSKQIYANDEKLHADYIYVSRIEYKNGSVWTDPFGRKYFN